MVIFDAGQTTGSALYPALYMLSNFMYYSVQNGSLTGNGVVKSEKETSFSDKTAEHTGVVSVDFETREASAKIEKDFKYVHDTLVSPAGKIALQ